MRLVVPAPAKVNLFLHVTGQRADGYHTLESLFALIDWADTLTLEVRDDGAIVRASAMDGVAEHDDLALRAARALKAHAGTRLGVKIAKLDLQVVDNRLWSLRLPRRELAAIARTLGADVPFFVGGMPAVARGTGDALTPVSLPTQWLVLALPRVHVSTAAIFAAPELTRDGVSAKIPVFSEGYGRNDLQLPAMARFPVIGAALEVLSAHSAAARMTGSGSCVFAPFATEAQAREAISLRPQATQGFVARTLARHPLAAFA